MEEEDDDASWKYSAAAAALPFTAFLYAHHRGLAVKMIDVVYRRLGVGGLFTLPFMTLTMEKSVYDTANALQGRDPNKHPKGAGSSFPSGGHMLPSFALVPIQKKT